MQNKLKKPKIHVSITKARSLTMQKAKDRHVKQKLNISH